MAIKAVLDRKGTQNITTIKYASNGKVLKDYEEAYQKSVKKASKVAIKAVTSRPAKTTRKGQDLNSANISGPELAETDLWPMISAPATENSEVTADCDSQPA